jgi:hypothetical protein
MAIRLSRDAGDDCGRGVELFKQMHVGLSNTLVVERIYRAMRAARGN